MRKYIVRKGFHPINSGLNRNVVLLETYKYLYI